MDYEDKKSYAPSPAPCCRASVFFSPLPTPITSLARKNHRNSMSFRAFLRPSSWLGSLPDR